MNAQDVILGSRVAHLRELKTEISRLKSENDALRTENEELKNHFDLAVLAAVLSSNMDIALDASTCLTGEVGLAGEIRPVNRIDQRIREAEKLGFQHIIIPKYNLSGLDRKKFKIELVPVRKVEEALRVLFG